MTDIEAQPAGTATETPSRPSRWRNLLQSIALLRESRFGMIGAALVLFWIVMAITAPWLPLRDPLEFFTPLVPPLTETGDGGTFWLGTDDRGRDVLSRVIWSAVTSAAGSTTPSHSWRTC